MASASHVLPHSMAATSPPMPDDRWPSPNVHLPRSASYTYIPAIAYDHDLSLAQQAGSGNWPLRNGNSGKPEPDNASGAEGPIPGADHASSAFPGNVHADPPEKKRAKCLVQAMPVEPLKPPPSRPMKDSPESMTSREDRSLADDSEDTGTSRSKSPSPLGTTGPSLSSQSSDESPAANDVQSPLQPSEPSPSKLEVMANPPPVMVRPRRMSMRQSILGKRAVRPLSTIFKGSNNDPTHSKTTSSQHLPVSLSTDRLPALMHASPMEKMSPLPRPLSSDSLRTLGRAGSPRKKDELWSVFRRLDSDFQRFQTKTSALKANVVRSSLLPFLRHYALHPSNWSLRPEDLDRRTMILNKWWIALLEMVDGGSSFILSSADRPIILEGITGVMTRPEWRLPERRSHASLGKSNSNMSLESTGSSFLAESTYHNTCNTFTHNILTQTSIVVDKLSLRQAAASLATFAATTLAYAFYFCPGVAEVLVRLWAISSKHVRHVVDEFGVNEPTSEDRLDRILSDFPKHLNPLRFASLPSTIRCLRRQPGPVLSARPIDWHGPWLGRWCGQESDVFFVFIKQWHVLLEDFLPPSINATDKARAPAFVLLYAQMMTVLRSTFLGPLAVVAHSVPAPTFDDVLANADASAATLPLPAVNVTRQMAENRWVMLLRDVLSDRSPALERPSRTLAASFVKLVEATARRISRFDRDACFTLCDFLEEVVHILDRYQAANPSIPDMVNWAFWLEVCRHMSESQNTMSEIRLFAFLYSVWNIIVQDERRKTELCLGWLLTPDTFERFFCHWCPMSRAYYMRLVCWRLARAGEPSSMDWRITVAINDRLKTAWSQFLRLSYSAREDMVAPPSTMPSNPAPGRWLMIVPDDAQVLASRLLSFEDLTRSSTMTTLRPSQSEIVKSPAFSGRFSPSSRPTSVVAPRTTPTEPSGEKKRWNLLKTIRNIGGFGSEPPGPKTELGPPSPTVAVASSTWSSLGSRSPAAKVVSGPGVYQTYNSNRPPHAAHGGAVAPPNIRSSFKFSLEWVDRRSSPLASRLYAPSLPLSIQGSLPWTESSFPRPDTEGMSSTTRSSSPLPSATAGKYLGRALAEWALVVREHELFHDRRLHEGVPSYPLVETPVLGFDWFRKGA